LSIEPFEFGNRHRSREESKPKEPPWEEVGVARLSQKGNAVNLYIRRRDMDDLRLVISKRDIEDLLRESMKAVPIKRPPTI
jgi:hypothetical protein